jgi:galactose mutarotase-like enzyme
MTTVAAPHLADAGDDYEAVTLAAGELEARFVPALGMVGTSLRHAGEELLDCQAGLAAYARTGAVMGIPLLHPWANRLADHGYRFAGRDVRLPDGPPLVHCEDHGLPIHGLLAASPHWAVADAATTRLRAWLDFAAHPQLLTGFPFPHRLTIDVAVRPDALTIATTMHATGAVPVPVSFGYHPYLRLPGVPRAEWRVAFPERRHLIADARGIPTGAGEHQPAESFVLGDRSFDDGYDGLREPAAFSVSGAGRTVTVELERGYPVAQVFAPAGKPFICLEPMTAPTNALRSGAGLRQVAPGATFTATFSIAVRDSSENPHRVRQ